MGLERLSQRGELLRRPGRRQLAGRIDVGCTRSAWQLALTLQHFHEREGWWHDWATMARACLHAVTAAGDEVGRAHMSRSLAGVVHMLGDNDLAAQLLRQALDVFTKLHYQPEQALVYRNLGQVSFAQETYPMLSRTTGRPCSSSNRLGTRPIWSTGRCAGPRNGSRSRPTTAQRWADRYRGSARPAWPTGPAARTTARRRPRPAPSGGSSRSASKRRWGPARIADHLGLDPSTVHRVLTRYRLARLAQLDRATGRVIRRYERDRPGDLVHVDIKKLGNIPDGGGWRIHGRAQGNATAQPTATRPDHARPRSPDSGYGYLHTAVDDHSRLAYSEILDDETKETAAAFWHRAHAWFAAHGITVERVLTDNGSCYRSHALARHPAELGITHKRTRPYRPQTNGKVERFNRTLLDEWAYARPYPPSRTPRSLARLAAHLQSPPRPHRTRRPTTRQPRPQPHWAVHLGLALRGRTAQRHQHLVTSAHAVSDRTRRQRPPLRRAAGHRAVASPCLWQGQANPHGALSAHSMPEKLHSLHTVLVEQSQHPLVETLGPPVVYLHTRSGFISPFYKESLRAARRVDKKQPRGMHTDVLEPVTDHTRNMDDIASHRSESPFAVQELQLTRQ